MNILVLTQRFYPDTFGGSEHVAKEQAMRLALRGHKVVVLAERARENLPYDSIEDKVRIIRFGSEKQFSRFAGSSRTDLKEIPKELHRLSKEISFDVAIIHQPFIGLGFIRSGLKIPSLYVFHASTGKEIEFEGLRRIFPWFILPFEKIITSLFIRWVFKVERRVLRNVQKIGVFSEFSRKVLLGFIGETQRKIVKLLVGIDQELFSVSKKEEARKKLGLPIERDILLTVRRFTPRMGVRGLIEAMKIVLISNPNVQLLIIGEGPLKKSLQREIIKNSLQSKVTLVGAVPLLDLPLYYQASDLFVLPTEAFEGLGMSTLEALSTGLPVVGTPAGATPEILCALDPKLITSSIKADDIAAGINSFLNRSKAEKDSLKIKARQVAEKYYNWDKAIDNLESTLKSII